jgi:hypothetical protein
MGFVDWDWWSLDFGTRRLIRGKSATIVLPPLDFGQDSIR